MIARYGWSTSRDALNATNNRKRRTGAFWCVVATAALILAAVTVG